MVLANFWLLKIIKYKKTVNNCIHLFFSFKTSNIDNNKNDLNLNHFPEHNSSNVFNDFK